MSSVRRLAGEEIDEVHERRFYLGFMSPSPLFVTLKGRRQAVCTQHEKDAKSYIWIKIFQSRLNI